MSSSETALIVILVVVGAGLIGVIGLYVEAGDDAAAAEERADRLAGERDEAIDKHGEALDDLIDAKVKGQRWERVARGVLNGVVFESDRGYYPPVDIYDLLVGDPCPPGTIILETGPGRYSFIDEYSVLTAEERSRILTKDEMIGAYLAYDARWRYTMLVKVPWRRLLSRHPVERPKPEDLKEPEPPSLERAPGDEAAIPNDEPEKNSPHGAAGFDDGTIPGPFYFGFYDGEPVIYSDGEVVVEPCPVEYDGEVVVEPKTPYEAAKAGRIYVGGEPVEIYYDGEEVTPDGE